MKPLLLGVAITVSALGLASRASGDDGAAGLQVGEDPPAVTAATWLNTPDGKSPFSEGVSGKVVMIEFWGTWCGPCVRSMPHVQSIFERYGGRGLLVVGITRETAEVAKPFLESNKYTFPVGCDSTQECIGKFHLHGWPSTYLIGKDGKLAYVGDPYSVEAAVDTALGLEASPPTLLTQYLDKTAGKDAAALRSAMERLLEKAPDAFDLKAWALTVLGAAQEAPPPSGKIDAAKILETCAKAWRAGDAAAKADALTKLVLAGPENFELRSWVRDAYGKAYPLQAAELKTMLDGNKLETALDALLDRNPAPAVLAAAAKNAGFADWCRAKAPDARSFARKALMGLTYMMAEKRPEKIDWEAFSRDLSVSGMSFDKDQKHVVGLLIGGDSVMKDEMPGYVRRQLSKAVFMESVASGKPLKPAALGAEAEKERKKILDELKSKYG